MLSVNLIRHQVSVIHRHCRFIHLYQKAKYPSLIYISKSLFSLKIIYVTGNIYIYIFVQNFMRVHLFDGYVHGALYYSSYVTLTFWQDKWLITQACSLIYLFFFSFTGPLGILLRYFLSNLLYFSLRSIAISPTRLLISCSYLSYTKGSVCTQRKPCINPESTRRQF